jgi:site-specific DNA recombinase
MEKMEAMNVCLYCRISVEDRLHNGVSVAALRQLIEDARHKRFSGVLIFKLDRLTRSVRDLGTLIEFFKKHKVALVSLNESIDTTTSSGKLMLHILGAVSEWEVSTIRERTSWALRHRRDHLRVYGEVPYGFARTGKDLRPVAKELRIVRRIFHLRKKGKTLRAIAGLLNRDGIRTKKGRTWAGMTVKYMLDNSLYAPYLKGRR